jgi:TrmH family RNA methyltransferase
VTAYHAVMPPPPGPLEITSPANARIRHLVALRRRRARDRAGVTLVEGRDEIALALAAGVRPRALYYCPELAGTGRGSPEAEGPGGPGATGPGASGPGGPVAALGGLDLAERARQAGAEVVRVSPPVFGKIAYREAPDGWLAVVPAVPDDLGRLRPGPRALVLVCVGVEKPGNLGAILRTADAAGADAVIAADPGTDWGNPNLVRASKGTVFSVPVGCAPAPVVLEWLRGRGLALVATTPSARTLLPEVDLTGPVALAFGSEAQGLPGDWLAGADARVRIPVLGRADSLNVAACAAIVAYEALRQRIGAGPGQRAFAAGRRSGGRVFGG